MTNASNLEQANREQAAMWNGVAGQGWVAGQALLDGMYLPFEESLVAAANARKPARVLDIGCGTGATTLAIARALGTNASCTGIDISETMLALARERAAREGSTARFVRADAQSHAFEAPGFDLFVSRFGVMFFDDPIAAFANLHRAASAGGDLRLIVFRSSAENPFMTTAERAAAPLLPKLAPRDDDAPGQFALADRARVERILADAGWHQIDLDPIDVTCHFPASALENYVTRLGPVGRALADADERTRTAVASVVLDAFAPYVHGGEVRFEAACWMIAARASQVQR
jgi:SAM-dependent methyltransferase